MKKIKYIKLITILLTTSLAMGVQGCRSRLVKQDYKTVKPIRTVSLLPHLSDKAASQLFTKGVFAFLDDIVNGYTEGHTRVGKHSGKYIPKKLNILRNPLLRNTILSSGRGKLLQSCQFSAFQIEVDGKKETSDWLVTTGGKEDACNGEERYFWIIQQNKTNSIDILLASRGSDVSINKSTDSALSEVKVNNSGRIKVKNGDMLANGESVLLNKDDHGYVYIDCDRVYRLNGNHYMVYKETVQANVEDWQYYEKYWQPINDPRYQCLY